MSDLPPLAWLSDLYFAACNAVWDRLPEASRALLDTMDAENNAWMKAGLPDPCPPTLIAARDAVDADPFAAAAMALRRQGNARSHEEWKARQKPAA